MRYLWLLIAASVGLTLGCLGSARNRTGSTGPSTAADTTKPSTTPTNNTRPFWAKDDPPKNAPAPLSVPNPGSNTNIASNETDARPTNGGAGEYANYNGMLAGSLVDSFNRRVPRAYVQVVGTDGKSERPIEMAVENGYFVIPGLTPGRAYMLTARTMDGTRKLAGRAQAIPPNAQVVIRLSEDLYSGTIPMAPPTIDPDVAAGGAGIGRPVPDPSSPASRADVRSDGDGWRPDAAPAGGFAPAPPGPENPPPPPLENPPADSNNLPAINTENIAGRDAAPRREVPPLISVPNAPLPEPDPPPGAAPNRRAPLPPGPGASRAPSARVPSCEFVSRNRLGNLALRDVYGQPWEFRQAQGRYVLLDFFGTWCAPCMREVPHIRRLHEEFGPLGLEVVGIACENAAAETGQERVLDVIQKKGINYRVLLIDGPNSQNPVIQQFQIQEYPTLVLMDRSGQIVWRSGKHNPPGTTVDLVLQRLLKSGQ